MLKCHKCGRVWKGKKNYCPVCMGGVYEIAKLKIKISAKPPNKERQKCKTEGSKLSSIYSSMKGDLTRSKLKKIMSYDPETGVFLWRITPPGGRAKAGDQVGYDDGSGYLRTSIMEKKYRLHRLAFLYATGRFPLLSVDHINQNRKDNRWCNLREATASLNLQNASKRSDNTSGITGVYRYRRGGVYTGQWKVQASVDGKVIALGYFDTLLEAALVRLTWELTCPKWDVLSGLKSFENVMEILKDYKE